MTAWVSVHRNATSQIAESRLKITPPDAGWPVLGANEYERQLY
jgi:hypothetical protein